MGETRHGSNLQDFAMLAHWPTTTRQDACSSASIGYEKTATHSPGLTLTDAANLAGWNTPTADEAGGSAEQMIARKRQAQARGKQLGASVTALNLQAQLASWATPMAADCEGAGGPHHPSLTNQVTGRYATGSPARTGKRGQLNPAHTRWLMGYPPAWDACAVTAMPSSRKSRKSSSKRIST